MSWSQKCFLAVISDEDEEENGNNEDKIFRQQKCKLTHD